MAVISIKEKTEYIISGDYVSGVVKRHKWSWEFFPDDNCMKITSLSSFSLEGYIQDMKEIRDFLDAKKVAETLTDK